MQAKLQTSVCKSCWDAKMVSGARNTNGLWVLLGCPCRDASPKSTIFTKASPTSRAGDSNDVGQTRYLGIRGVKEAPYVAMTSSVRGFPRDMMKSVSDRSCCVVFAKTTLPECRSEKVTFSRIPWKYTEIWLTPVRNAPGMNVFKSLHNLLRRLPRDISWQSITCVGFCFGKYTWP